MRTQVYVEGGAPGRLARQCRVAFGTFLEKAGAARETFQVIACGGRGDAYGKFSREAQRGSPAILLVDAEGPVTAQSPWQHLQVSDGWQRPAGATDDQCHLMVQVMESWLVADADALAEFYGQGFRGQHLPANPNVEQIPKTDVLTSLQRATQGVSKGHYDKGKHSFEILATLDPGKVTSASPYADRLIQALT